MPFTPAHIAAVLPLRNRWKLVWSALVIGSVIPDLAHFFSLGQTGHLFHVFPGIVYLTFPISFFAVWAFHCIVKEPMLEILPDGVAQRLDPAPFRFRGQIALILLSLAIGIATHLAWDSFTHENTVMSEALNLNSKAMQVPVVGPRAIFKVLQWGSSALGLLLIVVALWYWYTRTKPRRTFESTYSGVTKFAFWSIVIVVALGVGVRHAISLDSTQLFSRWGILVTLIGAMAVSFWEVVAFCVFYQIHKRWMMKERTDTSASSTL
jgi:uncharacterized membrane protein